MKFEPKHASTKKISENIWQVSSLNGLLEEIHQISEYSKKTGTVVLYRGHKDEKWLIDSTFVRSFKRTLFDISPEEPLNPKITNSKELHLSILNLFLMKFGVLCKPSAALEAKAAELNLDSWFEFLKRIQQYPEEDGFFLKGTNIIDWSESSDVALFFANNEQVNDAALFVCDATATGNTHQKIQFGEVLELMDKRGNSNSALGIPLMINPPRQIANQRSDNQEAVYFSQMDMRFDLETTWKDYQFDNGGDQIILKIILPSILAQEINRYLHGKGIDEDFIYPDSATKKAKGDGGILN